MKILFICTHNRCRSILAEAIANHYGEGLIAAISAGSKPTEHVHPLTLRALRAANIPSATLHSKSWDEFEEEEIDYVITVCDKAAEEDCPLWFGNAKQLHWGIADPSVVRGEPEMIVAAFEATIDILKTRVMQLRRWMDQGIDGDELHQLMQQIPEQELRGTA